MVTLEQKKESRLCVSINNLKRVYWRDLTWESPSDKGRVATLPEDLMMEVWRGQAQPPEDSRKAPLVI